MLTRKQNRGGSRGGQRRRVAEPGFTLFELLIVVGILALLVAIIVPTLGAVKIKARKTQTLALMSNLAAGIDAYFQRFHAYPGPMRATVTTAAGNKISGSQNMLLGLTYPMAGSNTPPSAWPFTPNIAAPTGPIDYATQTPNGNYEQLAPYYTPGAKQVAVATGALGINGLPNFPVVFDAFNDGLPILYFRRTVGVETPVALPDASGVPAGYYVNENLEYTKGTLTSTSGTVYNQSQANFGVQELINAVSTTGGTATARGGYVLISAGVDRYYGTYKGKDDDMVQVGGD